MDAVFSALGDPVRLSLLAALAEGPKPVHGLAGLFTISRPAISRHLKVLKDAGLVREVKAGRENHYARVESGLAAARAWLGAGNNPVTVLPAALLTEVPPPSPEPDPRRRKARSRPAADPAPGLRPQLTLFD